MKNDWETIALRKKQCALINNPSLQKVWPEKKSGIYSLVYAKYLS